MSKHPEPRAEADIEFVDGVGPQLRPPVVDVRDPEAPDAIVEAVNAALADAPNTVVDPVLVEPTENTEPTIVFAASFQELPHTEDGELQGWLPPYRAREQFETALAEHLPEGYSYELDTEHHISIYEERP